MNIKKTSDMFNSQNNSDLEYNTPVIFDEKRKKGLIKTLTHISSDTGKTRHYTPAAQEWFNSIYSYNPNYTKVLPVADTNLMKLLKSYFNMEITHNVLKTKRMANRYKRLTTKRIFVGRGEIKHTSSKAVITFYVHNTNEIYLSRAEYLCKKALFYPKKALEIYFKEINNNKILSYNRPWTLKEFLTPLNIYFKEINDKKTLSYIKPLEVKESMTLPGDYNRLYIDYITSYIDVKNNYLSNLGLQRNILTKMVNMNLITEEDRNETLINLYDNVECFNHPEFKTYMQTTKEYYLSGLKKFRYLLGFNDLKFTKDFMSKLIDLVQNIYNKKVEFNIVNLKKMHLNSDIFTQAVALKLRNRDNKLYRVLKSSLRKVKLPNIYRINERSNKINKDELFANIIRNDNISSMFNNNNANDPLNNLLLDFFPSADNLKVKVVKRTSIKERSISFKNYVLKSLKHLNMRGIKVEAKGRITRRFTASRSVFKMKWKGGLKNVDSSFRGLSAIMLRGYVKSNVQYSFINSKNRNGAFGVKGWVSSK